MARLWFDCYTSEIVTETEMQNAYNEGEFQKEYGENFTFEDYVNMCETSKNGALMEIQNAQYFKHIYD